METFLDLSLALALLILAAKLGGYLSYLLGQPSVLGELVVGILLGPTLVNFVHLPFFSTESLNEVIHLLAELGVMLLMFIAGIDLHLADLMKTGKTAALAGVFGVIFPLGLGAGMGLIFNLEWQNAIFLGLILSATSVSISAQTLMELKVLRTPVGMTLLGAAVFDDILVILGLSIYTALTSPGDTSGFIQVGRLMGEMLLFLGLAAVFGVLALPRLSRKVSRLPISQGLITFVFVALLLYGWAAERLGHMAPITGAFLAGLFFSRSQLKERIASGISILAYAVFVPIFFVDVGLSVNARLLVGGVFWLFLTLVLVAVAGKIIGSGLGAYLGKLGVKDSLRLGVGMVSRGEVGLIVATVGINAGLINPPTFAAVVGVIIVTTLLTPPLLRALYKRDETPAGAQPAD